MEPYDFVHSIKSEKANALAQYRLFTNIAKAVQLMEAFVAIALASWSSTRLPSVFRLSGEYLFVFASYLMNQHVVFLVGNVIVFVCYVLSRFTDSGNESGVSGIHHHDSIDNCDYLTRQKTVAIPPNSKAPLLLRATETPPESGILMIPNDKAITKTKTVTKPSAVTAINQAAKQIERFQRIQSDVKSKISVKNHPKLRRSVTERRRIASGELESMVKSFQAVDTLSDEEFRIAVETFISKQQRFLKLQSTVAGGS